MFKIGKYSLSLLCHVMILSSYQKFFSCYTYFSFHHESVQHCNHLQLAHYCCVLLEYQMSKADEVNLNNARSIFCVQYTCTPNRLVEIENRYACVIIHGKHYLFNSIKFCTSCALLDLQCGTSSCPIKLLASSTNFAACNVVLYFCVGICYGITVACLLIGLVKTTNLYTEILVTCKIFCQNSVSKRLTRNLVLGILFELESRC